jgi:histidine triad (HIT) family protein
MATRPNKEEPMDNCIFCQIIAGKAPASVVYRDEQIIAFMSLQQVNEGHTLVVPIRHLKNIYELTDDLAGPLLSTAARVARVLKREFNADGMMLWQFNELAGNQSVFHLHIHVIPRFYNDRLGPRIELPPPSDRATLDNLAGRIRPGLEAGG